MTDITTRADKGAPLTHDEVDQNFLNLKETADLAYAASAGLGGKANAAALGTDDAATDLGAFTSDLITNGTTAKGALQELATAIEVGGKFSQLGTGAVLRDGQAKIRDGYVSPEDFGAVGDGNTDDALPLQLAINTGKLVRGAMGKTYAFGQRLDLVSGGGLAGINLLMLTGTGKFDAAAYSGGHATNKIGVYGATLTNVRVDAVITMQPNAGVRVCSAVALRGCSGVRLKVEASGFKESEFPIVGIDSCPLPVLDVYVHDCGHNSTSLPTMQITGLGIDYNRTSGNTLSPLITGYFKNIRLGATASAFYTEQTDGCNIQSTGYSGARVNIYAENVGEGFDNFGSGVTGIVNAQDCVNYGLKMVHGASDCVLSGSVNGTGGAAVVLGGSSLAACNNNDLSFSAKRVGALTPPNALVKAAFQTDGSSATYQPTNNRVRITADGTGGTMTHVVSLESGSGNTVDADGTGFTSQFGTITSPGTNNVIRRKQNTHIAAYMGTATTVTHNTTIAYDTETLDPTGEYNPASGVATVRCAGRYRCRAQVRAGGIASLQTFGIALFVNSTEKGRIVPVQPAATTQEMWPMLDMVVDCAAGDTISFRCLTSVVGAVTITNQAVYSFMQIEQI